MEKYINRYAYTTYMVKGNQINTQGETMNTNKITEERRKIVSRYIQTGRFDHAEGFTTAIGFNTVVEYYEELIKQDGLITSYVLELAMYHASEFEEIERNQLIKFLGGKL